MSVFFLWYKHHRRRVKDRPTRWGAFTWALWNWNNPIVCGGKGNSTRHVWFNRLFGWPIRRCSYERNGRIKG